MSNTVKVKTDGGETEVYVHEICRLFDEYIEQLDNPEDVYKASGFAACCKYVYLQLFKPQEPQLFNKKTVLDTSDIELLDRLWDVYAMLSYKYGMKPTIERFALMVGISRETFNTWDRREYRASSAHSDTFKKWKCEAQAALVDSVAQTGNIGAIFLLKSCYGFRETSPITPEEMLPEPRRDSPEQIAARHRNAIKPELPNLD